MTATPSYSGYGTDVSEAKRWILAKQLLSGSAKTYIAHVAPLTWKDLRCELLQVFEKKDTSWDVGKQLEARKIAKGESALQYFVVMCGVAAQTEIATTDVVKFIVEGLQDQPSPVIGRNNEITKGRPSAKSVSSQSQNVNEIRCYNCRRFGHVMKECTQPKRPDGECFGCWSTDHQYAQCPKRKMTTTIAAVQDDESLVKIAANKQTGTRKPIFIGKILTLFGSAKVQKQRNDVDVRVSRRLC
ncbi:hypothetical protein ACLKA6_002585 [Drosophila palustris]